MVLCRRTGSVKSKSKNDELRIYEDRKSDCRRKILHYKRPSNRLWTFAYRKELGSVENVLDKNKSCQCCFTLNNRRYQTVCGICFKNLGDQEYVSTCDLHCICLSGD